MSTSKGIATAQLIASDLTLRLKGLGQSGANIAAAFSFYAMGSSSVPTAAVLVGTQGTGAHTNSATILIVPEQTNITTGLSSNLWKNAAGMAQEVYAPNYVIVGYEATGATNPFDTDLARMIIMAAGINTGMRVELRTTNAGTAPTPVNVLAGNVLGSYVIDLYNPLTNQQ